MRIDQTMRVSKVDVRLKLEYFDLYGLKWNLLLRNLQPYDKEKYMK